MRHYGGKALKLYWNLHLYRSLILLRIKLQYFWIWCISCCCIIAPSEAGWAGERTAGEASWVVNRRAEEQNGRTVEHAQRKRQRNTGTTEQPGKQQRAGQSSYYSHQFKFWWLSVVHICWMAKTAVQVNKLENKWCVFGSYRRTTFCYVFFNRWALSRCN